jgi:polysaccharide pyruvyl transferase WcaK-like protein
MKAVILNYTGGRNNWGSQATSRTLAEFLVDALQDTGISEIDTVPLPPPHVMDTYVRRRHGRRLSEIYANPKPVEADLAWLRRLTLLRFGPLYSRVKDARVVFFQGEGTITGRSFDESVRLYAPFLLSLHDGIPVVTLNQSIAPQGAQSEAIVANLFGHAQINSFRETVSYRTALALGVPNAVMCPDTVFRLNAANAAFVERPNHFCVSGSAQLDAAYISSFAEVLRTITAEFKLEPVFLSATGDDHALYHAFRKLMPDAGRLMSQTSAQTYLDMLPVIASAAFTIGGRYHTAATSASQGVPVILTPSNSHKSVGLSELLFGGNQVKSPEDAAALLTAVRRAMSERETEYARLLRVMQDFETEFDVMKARIREIVAHKRNGASRGRCERTRTGRNEIANPKQAILGQKRSRYSMSWNRKCYDCEWEQV